MHARFPLALLVTFAFLPPLAMHAAIPSPRPAATPTPAASANPLLAESALPFQMPPFDRIKDEHYAPAFAAALAEHLQEVEAIADSTAEPTFENTFIALEKAGQKLKRVEATFMNMAGAHTNPALQKVEAEMSPKLAAHKDAIFLNPKLFARIQKLHDQREQLRLDAESTWLIERYLKEFTRAGAKLKAAEKKKLKELNTQIATLQTQFTQNLLKEKNASSVVVENRAELAGLSENEIAAAARAAADDKKEGKFVIAMQNTSGQPALSSLQNRALRERIMKTSLDRNSKGGPFDTRETVMKIARLRAERAALLGYPTHADYQLEDQTARSVATVNKLLDDLIPLAVANAKREVAEIDAVIKQEGGDFHVEPWDWSFYSEKVLKQNYAVDEAQLKPYFEINHVLIDGVFFAATQVYGITFKERKDLPIYQEDVRVFEVADADGQPLALFLADFYARPSKRGGAWMNEYVSQSDLLGKKPVVGNHLNIPKPPAGEPTLLTFDEVRTMFHEFGHALHGIFSKVKYPHFSGTSVPTDFVEFPSQVNEMWATWPEIVQNYARHYQTGEALPRELLDKMIASQKHNQGFATTEYLAATFIDQAWHQLKPDGIPQDPLAFEAETLKAAGFDVPVPPRYRTCYFSHSFSGDYSAGYYSYIWSEVLDAGTVEWIKQHGGLKRENGDRFRRTLLSRGHSQDALEQFRNFTGGEPDLKPLLQRRGLTGDAPARAPGDLPPEKAKP